MTESVLDAIMDALDKAIGDAVRGYCSEWPDCDFDKEWAEARAAVAAVLLDRGVEQPPE